MERSTRTFYDAMIAGKNMHQQQQWMVCNKTGGDDVCSQVTEGRHRKLRCDRLIRRRQQQQPQKRDALPLMVMMCNANARYGHIYHSIKVVGRYCIRRNSRRDQFG